MSDDLRKGMRGNRELQRLIVDKGSPATLNSESDADVVVLHWAVEDARRKRRGAAHDRRDGNGSSLCIDKGSGGSEPSGDRCSNCNRVERESADRGEVEPSS
jgi:hypothetical protein